MKGHAFQRNRLHVHVFYGKTFISKFRLFSNTLQKQLNLYEKALNAVFHFSQTNEKISNSSFSETIFEAKSKYGKNIKENITFT